MRKLNFAGNLLTNITKTYRKLNGKSIKSPTEKGPKITLKML